MLGILMDAVEVLLETTDVAKNTARAATIVELSDISVTISVEVHLRIWAGKATAFVQTLGPESADSWDA